MRICFSMDPPRNVAAGGGVKFVLGLEKYLIDKGCKVEFGIDQNDLPDLIFMFDPRHLSYSRNFLTVEHIRGLQDILNSNVPIIHRLNDIGEPKDRPQDYVPNMIELANRSTHIIYVSDFVKEYYGDNIKTPSTIIHNGVDRNLFTLKDYEFDKIRLVTHHWSSDYLKGWDIYKEIDDWMDENKDIEFIFIGNTPNNINLKNIKVYPPVGGKEMVDLLKTANIYITASRYEPCGNHYIEGVACGLPLLYHTDGGGVLSMKDYGYGYKDFNDFKEKLSLMTKQHRQFYDKIKTDFNHYHDVIFENVYQLIKGLK